MTSGNFTTELFYLNNQQPRMLEQSLTGKTSNANFVGVCFSGGGSRALSAAMGQLRGLRYLGVLDDVFFISAVSGGTWATSLFTYLPDPFTDDDFLGLPVTNPGDLTVYNWDPNHPEYALDYLSPHNLGKVPQRLGLFSDLEAILNLKLRYNYSNNDLWQGMIGSQVLAPWNLWSTDDNGHPNKYYSLSDAYLKFKGGILEHNPDLSADQFYTVRKNRPFYVMNGSMFSNPTVSSSQLLPFESTPLGIGVRGFFPEMGPDGRDIGGGLIQPFAMTSSWEQDLSSRYSKVTRPNRPYSLADMVGVSSAAFAKTVQDNFPQLDGLVPTYDYWPVAGHEQPRNSAYPYLFADGGNLEDTGITSLLNRNLPYIIAFVNAETPLSKENGEVVISTQIQKLFGMDTTDAGCGSQLDTAFTQVFDSADYLEMANGLYDANAQGGTAMYKQTLEVLPNPNFDIRGNYTTTVLWVYNTNVPEWNGLLTDEVTIYKDTVPNFPNYDTVSQLELSAREVNLLAQLSFWNITSDSTTGHPGTTNAKLVKSMFYN